MKFISDLNPRHLFKAGLLTLAANGSLFASYPALCGPPFVTDDPGVLEYRHHELIIAAEQVNTQDGKTARPNIQYSYGVLPDLQVGITVPYVIDRPNGQAEQYGIGDLVLGAKYRLLPETDSRPMMTFAPLMSTPNGDADKGLGNGGSQVFLPVWIQKQWGNWLSYGGGGYWINNAQDAGNHWYYGAVLQYDLSVQFSIGAELFHETDQLPADVANTWFNVGGIYNLDQHQRLLMSVGRSLTDTSTQNRFFGFVAYAVTW
jgi:hypothetical protein